MGKKYKFRSGLNKYIFIALAFYHAAIIVPFFINNYLWKDVITWYAYTLLAIDALILLPLIFNTYYSLEDTYLFVFQWPFTRLKIYYNDIFIIDSDLPSDASKKQKKKYGFTNKELVIGFYAEVADRKEKKIKKVKKYIAITPKEYDAFMIRIGGKFTSAKKVASKLEETLKINEEEHKKKKASVALERRKKSEENKPVDVVIEPKKKTDLNSDFYNTENSEKADE